MVETSHSLASPLDGHYKPGWRTKPAPTGAVTLMEVLGRGLVQITGRLHAFAGFALPQEPNTCVLHGQSVALWLGPRRWLLAGSETAAQEWLRLKTPGVAVNDLSQSRLIVRIMGETWREVIARACPLHLEQAFRAARWSCAQSLFAEVPVLLITPPSLLYAEMLVPRSYGLYIWEMLLECTDSLGCYIAPRGPAALSDEAVEPPRLEAVEAPRRTLVGS